MTMWAMEEVESRAQRASCLEEVYILGPAVDAVLFECGKDSSVVETKWPAKWLLVVLFVWLFV